MIIVNQLRYSYAHSMRPAVDGISFEVGTGEIFGLLGPSGAGKSTTQKILIGLLRDYQGSVGVLRRDLRAWDSDYYERVGVCFEMPTHHLKLTALENLAYFRSLYAGETSEPLRLLQLVGLAEDAKKPVSQFSKGMSTRLSLARALLNKPALLFLDEPTAGLDPVNARRVKDLIRQQRADGVTVFLTTHDMALADELCDRVAFLVDGAIQLIDEPRALRLQRGKRMVRVEYGAERSRQCQEYPLEGLGENVAFLQLLREEQVQTMHTAETTLENIFIEVTGRSPE